MNIRYKDIKPKSMRDMINPADAPRYPEICVDLKTLPEAKDWKIGQTYELAITVSMSEINKEEAEFEITKIATL